MKLHNFHRKRDNTTTTIIIMMKHIAKSLLLIIKFYNFYISRENIIRSQKIYSSIE